MATDGPTPPPCDPEVFQRGTVVFRTSTIPSVAMEGWVLLVRSRSGQRVDWFFCGGRAVVKAIGDLAAVHAAIEHFLPLHEQLYRDACQSVMASVGLFSRDT